MIFLIIGVLCRIDIQLSRNWVSTDHLLSLDEKRMDALFHTQIYQRRIARAFNKKVKPRKIKVGDMVLKQ